MFSQFIEKIHKQYALNLPFVVYRKPNQTAVRAIFQDNDTLHKFTDFNKVGFIFGAFDDRQSIRTELSEVIEIDYNLELDTEIEKFNVVENNPSKKEFHINLVKQAIQEIEEGTFEKVVISRKIEVQCKTHPLSLFKLLLKRYSNTFCYIWYHPKVGLWIGATPETLLTAKNNSMTTMSLAGTIEFRTSEDPNWGEKELNEQELVTKYISDNLKDKLKNMKISGPNATRAGNLWHLKSIISGEMSMGLQEAIDALHPTPAVCGLPKEESKTFIVGNENYNREFYTGFLGEVNFGENRNESQLFVNLRCMQLIKDNAMIYVGGGITKASMPEKEWEETNVKAKTMLNIINYFK